MGIMFVITVRLVLYTVSSAVIVCEADADVSLLISYVATDETAETKQPNTTTPQVSVSASYCIPQCVRLIAGVCTHYVVYNISKKKNTVDKSKIKDKRKVQPKDKSWVKIGWRTKNRKGWCVQKR